MVLGVNYELLVAFFRSRLACCWPFLASVLLLVFGLRVEMAFPKLIDLPVVAAGHAEVELEGAVPVIALFRQSKLMPRFLLTWAAATHCPRFLKPVQDCCADSPVSEAILPDSCV